MKGFGRLVALALLFIGPACSEESAPPVPPGECTRNGVCSDGVFCNGEEECHAGTCVAGTPVDCDDAIECTQDECDEATWACRHTAPDADSDGQGDAACLGAGAHALGDDCDDADPARHAGALEMCDAAGIDEDCDPSTVGDQDNDGDGAIAAECCNTTSHERQCGPDCNDNDPTIAPSAAEVCDGLDNDCDTEVDEAVELAQYEDVDGDHYGGGEVAFHACTKVRGYATVGGDCDDLDPAIHPGAPESCELPAVDRDCSGKSNDLPGGCSCNSGDERACPLPGACEQGILTCVDEVWSACSIPPVTETCNGVDDDCDGEVDEDAAVECFEDEDGDGFAAAGAEAELLCPTPGAHGACPQAYTARAPAVGSIDCSPLDPKASPASDEVCNGEDDDCSGVPDDGLPLEARFIDADGDGHAGTPAKRCANDPQSSDSADDCMDDNALVHPGQDGVFANPACRRGLLPCALAADDWRCRPADASCEATQAPARWDYDCDDHASGPSFVAAPCSMGGVCADGCGPSGFVAPQSGQPVCGSVLGYQVCKCLGAQGGGCTGYFEERPYPCD